MSEIKAKASPHVKAYLERLHEESMRQFAHAQKAKARGLDTSTVPETTPALDLADRCENISGPPGVAQKFRALYKEKKGKRVDAVFELFRQIVMDEWGEVGETQKRVEQGIKTALVLMTEGVVVAPLDGVPCVKISKNPDGTRYVDVYFAGPIRAAGGTATVFPLILADYAQKLLGLDTFKATEEEVERYVEEAMIYQNEIVSRQIKMTEDEVRIIIRNCPVCINGDPTEDKEVGVHRDLDRFPSNRIRGAACLVLTEGVALKASKILTFTKKLELDWNWLEQIIKVSKKDSEKEIKIAPNMKYLDRIAAGRPIFSYPLRVGGFRLRYGRGRNCGAMGRAIHPATMVLLDNFVAVGTQIKVERPGKSAQLFPCDTIEGPIVKLKNQNVVHLQDREEALRLMPQVEQILYLGDMLISYGDFRKTAHPLVPPGYCEEWWRLELEQAKSNLDEGFDHRNVAPQEAVELSTRHGIPLHPEYTHYYGTLDFNELGHLAKKARDAQKVFEGDRLEKALFSNEKDTKRAFEKIGLPHEVDGEWLSVGHHHAYPLLKTFGAINPSDQTGLLDSEKSVFENLKVLSGLTIRDKGGTFMGARMGRPEAARPRKMTGNPHVLFPIGWHGGAIRSINKAMEASQKNGSSIDAEIALYRCPSCHKVGIRTYCAACGEKMEMHEPGAKARVNLDAEAGTALSNLRVKMPEIVKGVKGLISDDKISEPLEKGILRATHDVHIFRDGTVRYEMLNAPLTHFRPRELGLTVARARELGYVTDWKGKPLENEEQVLELFAQDIVVNKESGEFLLRVSRFVDDLLVKFYGVEAIHNYTKKEDLIGELVLALAPHTSAAIVGRVIGFTHARLCFAHPFFHLCKRRNIDGDQDSVMLLTDALLNFSEKYLASSRGGRMDAPLVFTVTLDPTEIDDEAYEMETCERYPLSFYEKASQIVFPDLSEIPRVSHKLGTPEQYTGINFTHDTHQFDLGPTQSRYTELKSMEEKMRRQAKLQAKIRALDHKDALERVIVSHFLPDIIGNARAFSRQSFRCTSCNTIYRRVPLVGKCRECGGNLILTIAQGSVSKYLAITKAMAEEHQLSAYLRQRIDLIEQEIASVFQSEKKEQKSLFEYV